MPHPRRAPGRARRRPGRARAAGRAWCPPTPVAGSRALSELCGGPVWLKCENLQRTGSFKIRGAYTRIARLDAEQRARGVVAASAGNHAQGVALAAQMLGIRGHRLHARAGRAARRSAPPAATAPRCTWSARRSTDSIAAATEFAERTGAVLVHPFDHPDVIAGQGTVGLEILEQVPDVRTVLVVHRRRRAARRGRGGGEGPAPGRRGGRGAGRRRRGLARVAGRRRARRAGRDAHDRRRHRRRPAG